MPCENPFSSWQWSTKKSITVAARSTYNGTSCSRPQTVCTYASSVWSPEKPNSISEPSVSPVRGEKCTR